MELEVEWKVKKQKKKEEIAWNLKRKLKRKPKLKCDLLAAIVLLASLFFWHFGPTHPRALPDPP